MSTYYTHYVTDYFSTPEDDGSTRDETLDAQIETTQILIDQEGLAVVLKRLPPPTPDNAGGFNYPSEDDRFLLPPVKRYFGSVREIGTHDSNPQGERFTTGHVLIGMPDDDIQTEDIFELWGQEFKIEYIQPDRRYQTKAFVVRHASP